MTAVDLSTIPQNVRSSLYEMLDTGMDDVAFLSAGVERASAALGQAVPNVTLRLNRLEIVLGTVSSFLITVMEGDKDAATLGAMGAMLFAQVSVDIDLAAN